MSESSTRSRTIKALASLDAVAIENKVGPGTPDIEYIGGWIECKQMDRWPKVPVDKPILLKHPLSKEQRLWAIRRARAGGRTWVLLQVGNEWLLFTGPVAARYVGYATKEGLIRVAHSHWTKGLVDDELLEAVR